MLDLMNTMFDDFYRDLNFKGNMPTDIVENDDEYVMAIDVPGVAKENINISFDNSYLTIKVTDNKEEEDNNNYIRHEITSYDMSRSYYLANADENNIKAKLDNGVLYVKVGKVAPTKLEKKYIAIE